MEQWPIKKEKLEHIQCLVQEQLDAGHIEPTTSPWNTPIFTIPKRSGKWRLLYDLHAINAVMFPMGPLQPGLPSPVMIPKDWPPIVIDIKDFFSPYPCILRIEKNLLLPFPLIITNSQFNAISGQFYPNG